MKGNDLKNELTISYDKLLGFYRILDDFDMNNIRLSLKDKSERDDFSLCEDCLSSAVNNLRSALQHFIPLHFKIRNRNYE